MTSHTQTFAEESISEETGSAVTDVAAVVVGAYGVRVAVILFLLALIHICAVVLTRLNLVAEIALAVVGAGTVHAAAMQAHVSLNAFIDI